MVSLRRYLLLLPLVLWLGGLTFYAVVVVPIGGSMFGTSEQGFITQRVTEYLNWVGGVALAGIFLEPSDLRRPRVLLSWGIMLAAEVFLVAWHFKLDGLLDTDARTILDGPLFYERHRVYLLGTAVQWVAALVLLWALLHRWSQSTTSPVGPAPRA